MGREGRGRGRSESESYDLSDEESTNMLIGPPQDHFGWLTEIGVCHGDLLTSKVIDAESDDVIGNIVSHQTLMSFPNDHSRHASSDPVKSSWGELQSFLLLDFHVALLYTHCLLIVSRLRDRIVMEVPFEVRVWNSFGNVKFSN